MGIVGRLLVLLAVLLMPLGMAPAAASASPVDHRAMAGMAMEHCPDQSNKHEHNDGLTMCSMACASALPAQELTRDEMPLRHHQLVGPTMTQTLHGILLEIATPPPKLA
jgi:hypothetical protein